METKIYLSSPHMGGNEQKYIKQAFDTNWLAPLGPNVDKFEKSVAEYIGWPHTIALSSGTAAIHMALKCLGVTKGDKVICSTFTFAASCNPIIYEGAEPIFIDSDYETWNMSPKALRKAFESCEKRGIKPKAVIVVHLYGQSANMEEIVKICKQYNVPIIEDAAESLGATYKGVQTGTIGDYGIYSFNGNKIITTSGGGMLVAKTQEDISKVKFLSTQARDAAPWYEHSTIGYNYRMSNVLAGMGIGQMEVLNDRIAKKKAIFEEYSKAFKDTVEVEMMPISKDGKPNYWLSCITLTDEAMFCCPSEIISELQSYGIESRRLWKPMHLQPVFYNYEFYSHFSNSRESVSEDLFKRGICLPSDTKMKMDDVRLVAKIVKRMVL